jgi:uncharacterized protein YbjQ (UPF0145 family)
MLGGFIDNYFPIPGPCIVPGGRVTKDRPVLPHLPEIRKPVIFSYARRYYTEDIMTNEIIIVSTPYVPGYKITRTIGVTWGLIVRSRGLGRNITAGLRSLIGGEIHEYTELLNQSRDQALARLREHAQALGANAVVSMQFDSSEIGQTMTELLAYGTAVVVEKEETLISPVRLS